MQNNAMQWRSTLMALHHNLYGTFDVSDEPISSIQLHWHYLKAADLEFNQTIGQARDVLVQTYTELELGFAKQYPEKVKDEFFIGSLTPMVEGVNKVDWDLVKESIRQIFHAFYVDADFSCFANPEDTFIHVLAKDTLTDEVVGFVQYALSLEDEKGGIKVGYFGIKEDMYDKQLDQILISSIYKILPKTARLFLHTRATNAFFLERLASWGFKGFSESMPGWPDYEYLSSHEKSLQTLAMLRLC